MFLITIIDLGISNIKSITRGFITQGFKVRLTTKAEDVRNAQSLVLPGVGAFPKAMEVLKKRGLFDAIVEYAGSGKPLLGVCLGMQLFFSDSVEHGLIQGLGLVPGHVLAFPKDRPVPHMGWNEVVQNRESPLFCSIPDRADFYFVHSYYVQPHDEACVIGYTDYYGRFASVIRRENVYGTQFHPEKSQEHGLRLLRNFALLTGKR